MKSDNQYFILEPGAEITIPSGIHVIDSVSKDKKEKTPVLVYLHQKGRGDNKKFRFIVGILRGKIRSETFCFVLFVPADIKPGDTFVIDWVDEHSACVKVAETS